MSTELKSVGSLSLTQLWGGKDRGKCLQLTRQSMYVTLTEAEVVELIPALEEWLGGEREEA
jgi:hypothetical protein